MQPPQARSAADPSANDTGSPLMEPRGTASPIDLSIVIVNYNVKDFLLQCLRSLTRALQNIQGEIIVVDNHSADGSVSYLQPLFPEVQFIGLEENLGFARANNLGLERARGEFVLFLNPDTILEDRTLDVMLRYLRSHPEVGIGGCKVLNPDGTFQQACRRGFPTPWASFCKAFGLQRLFPRSRLFARYNQTFRSSEETHYVDAISGSFMFARRSALKRTGGFDPDFFMYGEDLDLCYRITQAGWKIAYVHDTSMIHFKGQSARRSPLDRVRLFYQAMELFARKHHQKSNAFLLLLRLGIWMRSLLAHLNRRRRPILILLFDAIAINLAMLIATRLRFGSYFGFLPYAYPTVFIVLTAVTVVSMLSVGEYFEYKPSLRRAFVGLMVNFFLLSSLTYFFKEFAFSRGVLLMTIAFGVVLTSAIRACVAFYDQSLGKEADRRILIVGANDAAEKIVRALQSAETRHARVLGVVVRAPSDTSTFSGLPVLGTTDYLLSLIEQHGIGEVIVTDESLERSSLLGLIANAAELSVRFHVATDYEDVVVSRIINEVAGIEPSLPQYNIARLRYRIVKRAVDLVFSSLMLTIGLPVVFLGAHNRALAASQLWQVLLGRRSFVGLHPAEPMPALGKIGLTGLVQISNPAGLSPQVVRELNEYYIQHYSLTLDFDIMLRFVLRRISGTPAA